MKVCVLINAHKNIEQLNRLIESLNSDSIKIYVHLDKKWDLDVSKVNNSASLIKNRVSVTWGDYSQVEATLSAVEEVLEDCKDFDYITFISAQDYPIVSMKTFTEFLEDNKGKEFMSYDIISDEGWSSAKIRYEYIFFKNRYLRFAVKQGMRCLGIKRSFISGYTPYGGSSWWTLSKDCVKYITSFTKENPKFVKYLKTTACSDELYFQTIVLNSRFKDKVVNNNYRYIDWSDCEKGLTSSPRILEVSDYDKIVLSNNHFARKFDIGVDSKILDLLDLHRNS